MTSQRWSSLTWSTFSLRTRPRRTPCGCEGWVGGWGAQKRTKRAERKFTARRPQQQRWQRVTHPAPCLTVLRPHGQASALSALCTLILEAKPADILKQAVTYSELQRLRRVSLLPIEASRSRLWGLLTCDAAASLLGGIDADGFTPFPPPSRPCVHRPRL